MASHFSAAIEHPLTSLIAAPLLIFILADFFLKFLLLLFGTRRNVIAYHMSADTENWSFRYIEWKKLCRRQDHANLILTASLIVAVAVCSSVLNPRVDDFYIYDGKKAPCIFLCRFVVFLLTGVSGLLKMKINYAATISYPPGGRGFSPTVPTWVAIVIPLLMMLCTIIVGEFVYSKRQHHSVTDAIAVTLYFILDAFQVGKVISIVVLDADNQLAQNELTSTSVFKFPKIAVLSLYITCHPGHQIFCGQSQA